MEDWRIETIVLGYDGSEGAKEAVRLASAVARRHSARVFVVSAFGMPLVDGREGDRAFRRIDEAHASAREIARDLREAGIEADSEALEGPAGDALLRVAETRGADLIVLGRRGHGLLAGLLLGSTPEYVVRRANVPVLVAP
jgi:nucleotide-binding universal stress UspA family protein